jgi:hypothetical protein
MVKGVRIDSSKDDIFPFLRERTMNLNHAIIVFSLFAYIFFPFLIVLNFRIFPMHH